MLMKHLWDNNLPQEAGKYACVPDPLEDKVSEGSVISFCICQGSTSQLCIQQFGHFPVEGGSCN